MHRRGIEKQTSTGIRQGGAQAYLTGCPLSVDGAFRAPAT